MCMASLVQLAQRPAVCVCVCVCVLYVARTVQYCGVSAPPHGPTCVRVILWNILNCHNSILHNNTRTLVQYTTIHHPAPFLHYSLPSPPVPSRSLPFPPVPSHLHAPCAACETHVLQHQPLRSLRARTDAVAERGVPTHHCYTGGRCTSRCLCPVICSV